MIYGLNGLADSVSQRCSHEFSKDKICDALSVDLLSSISKMINMNSLEQLGSRIREKRAILNLSQEKLAEKCSFDRTYISLIERGKRNPSYKNLLKLAKGLCISISELTQGLE